MAKTTKKKGDDKTDTKSESPKQKTVYSFDPNSGAYVGETIANESPLEPGIFHLPAYSTEVEPPASKDKFMRVFSNGEWIHKPIDEVAYNEANTEENIAKNARHHRDVLLFQSDWSQLPDADLSDAELMAYTQYRKELRNITKQKGWPTNIEWPTKPKK